MNEIESIQPIDHTTQSLNVYMRRTPAQVKADADLILQVMQACMREGIDYGVIPGTDKPTLYKPGSEKIMMTFRLAAKPTVYDLSVSDEIRYRVTCEIIHAPTGTVIGYGVGEASTNEDKYKWRSAVCAAEWEETPEDRRRKKWKGKSQNAYQVDQVRTNPSDLANTVLKMADKRAVISGILKATAASAIFGQDLEDLASDIRESVLHAEEGTMPPPMQEPQPLSSQASATASPGDEEPIAFGSAPATWRQIASKVDKGSCGVCSEKIALGEAIYFDPEKRKAYHRKHYA